MFDQHRAALVRIHLVASGVLVALVLLQAVLAGQGLFNGSSFDLHGYLGNGSFVVGTLAAAAAMVGRLPRPLMTMSLAVAVGLFCQTGLGYVGRESTAAASWHVPLGVAIFGLSAVQVTLAGIATPRGRAAA